MCEPSFQSDPPSVFSFVLSSRAEYLETSVVHWYLCRRGPRPRFRTSRGKDEGLHLAGTES
jgi:hypothetical protein